MSGLEKFGIRFLVAGLATLALVGTASSAGFRVRDFGAKGDGVTKDTAAGACRLLTNC